MPASATTGGPTPTSGSILESRTRSTDLLARTLAGLDRKPSVLLSGSAVGFYGDRGDEELTEQSAPGRDFLAGVCVAWEAAAKPARDAGIRVAHLRTGIVLSPDGGALKKQLPLFKLFLGGRFGGGSQWQSWISVRDEVGAILHLLEHDVAGPVNLTAPHPVTNGDFAKALGRGAGRPSVVPVPSFGPKLVLGAELGRQPAVLQPAGAPGGSVGERLHLRPARAGGRAPRPATRRPWPMDCGLMQRVRRRHRDDMPGRTRAS